MELHDVRIIEATYFSTDMHKLWKEDATHPEKQQTTQ